MDPGHCALSDRPGQITARPATILLLLKRIDCVDGVAAYLETLLGGLRQTGDRVIIVSGVVTTPDGSEARREAIRSASCDWIELPGLDAAWPGVAHVRQITAIIAKYDVDVISPQGFSVLPLAYLAGRLTGRAVVATYHPSLHGDEASAMTGSQSGRGRLAYRLVTTVCPAWRYIAASRHIALFFRACGIPQSHIHEQVMGIDNDFFRPPSTAERRAAREQFGLADTTLVAVLPGRLNFNKGHDVAADAFRLLRKKRPDLATACLFPGGGGQRDTIEQYVLRDAEDRANFHFLGFVAPETLRATYWAADIVVLPSRVEGFGLVVAEAMCCGAIVIRTPSGGWQDQVIEGKTGYIVPFNDPEALAAAIETVADMPDRATMRREVMRYASGKFAKSQMVAGTSALYREAAGQRKAIGRRKEAVLF